jgi:ribose transport system permease protein
MNRVRPAEIIERYGLLLLLAAVIVFFAVDSATPQFSNANNIRNILGGESVLGIIAIATVIPLVAGHFDLSIGPAAGLSSLLTAGLMSKSGWALGPAIVVGISCCIAIGAVNGVLVARMGINSIIATLGMSSLISAGVQYYSAGQTISTDIAQPLLNIGSENWFGIPRPFFFLVVVGLVAWYVLEHTPPGRYLYAAGASPRAAELVGIGVPRYTFASFVFAGLFAGVAGVLMVAVNGAANPLIGPDYMLPAIAAVFLGATAIKPGRYNVAGTVAAVYFLAVSVNGLTLLGADTWVSDLFNGAALLIAVSIAVWSGKRRISGRRASAADPPEKPPVGHDTPLSADGVAVYSPAGPPAQE